jgi:hypothetical protein
MTRLWYPIIFLFIFPEITIAQGRMEFVREKIDFSINSELFTVNGIYVLANTTDRPVHQRILFPFSGNSDSVDVKRVFNLSYGSDLEFSKVDKGITFRMVVMPRDTVFINIAYNQKTERENTYILESTQLWGKPLQSADFSLSFDSSVTIDSLSLQPCTFVNNKYYWHMTDFFPGENFTVWIKKK